MKGELVKEWREGSQEAKGEDGKVGGKSERRG